MIQFDAYFSTGWFNHQPVQNRSVLFFFLFPLRLFVGFSRVFLINMFLSRNAPSSAKRRRFLTGFPAERGTSAVPRKGSKTQQLLSRSDRALLWMWLLRQVGWLKEFLGWLVGATTQSCLTKKKWGGWSGRWKIWMKWLLPWKLRAFHWKSMVGSDVFPTGIVPF